MIFELNLIKGDFVKGTTKDNNILYRCNFLTTDDDKITLFLNEEEVKPYINVKKYDLVKVPINMYRASEGKGKYNFSFGGAK